MAVEKQKVSVIGLGYVGLPLALALSKSGKYSVYGFDKDLSKIKSLIKGINPLKDDKSKFLDQHIKKVNYVDPKNISTLKSSRFFIITVPTPVSNLYEPDYSYVINACESIAPLLEKNCYVILESTVNPGTCDEIVVPTLEKISGLKAGKDFEVSHCPERVNPGDVKWNVTNIPRNVGSLTDKGNKQVAKFYRSFIKAPINEVSSLKIAEATKIVENTFRDINIAFVNELAMSFDMMGIDILEVIKGASNKPFSFLAHYPGCGVGGHCIPVDPYYLIRNAEIKGFDHKFLKLARKINNEMPKYSIKLLKEKIKETDLTGKKRENIKIGLLGLSYKADVGDIRESPAIKIYELLNKNFKCKFFDPYIPKYSNFKSTKTLKELLDWSDALLLATAHEEFKKLPRQVKKNKNIKVFIDGRNYFKKEEFLSKIVYKGIGR